MAHEMPAPLGTGGRRGRQPHPHPHPHPHPNQASLTSRKSISMTTKLAPWVMTLMAPYLVRIRVWVRVRVWVTVWVRVRVRVRVRARVRVRG